MEEFIIYIVKNLLEFPDEVLVQGRVEGNALILSLEVAEADFGRVIGRRGKTIQAIRTLVGILAARHAMQVRLELLSKSPSEF